MQNQRVSLRDLLTEVAALEATPDLPVAHVRDDSRAVRPGDVFVAVAGHKDDGLGFVDEALAQGAVAVVSDATGARRQTVEATVRAAGAQFVPVGNARAALGHMLARFFGALERLRLMAVTGTNGKTTTTYVVEAMLRAAGRRPGVLGTVEYRYAGRSEAAPLTTPGPALLHDWLSRMANAGCSDVVLEASSHALHQDRLAGCTFAVAALTNVTQDHLDYHGTMAAYFDAKARLFTELLAPDGVGVMFVDREDGRQMGARTRARVLKVATSADAAGRADVWVGPRRLDGGGVAATVHTPSGAFELRSRLVGDYNLANLVLSAGMAFGAGLPLEAIAAGVRDLPGVPGRLEVVENQAGVLCVVDYAHTPDALERALEALRPLTAGRLMTVFGCGGDRDPTKRPIMGRIAAQMADVAIATSDNPRTEDPLRILDMILEGIEGTAAVRRSPAELASGATGFTVEPDRRAAIALAVNAARPGDVVLIAGKGHEDYQIVGTQKLHFDDRQEARAAFSARSEGERS